MVFKQRSMIDQGIKFQIIGLRRKKRVTVNLTRRDWNFLLRKGIGDFLDEVKN